MELIGKNIVITGGTAGIGFELVRALHARNTVFVIASNEPRLAKVREAYYGLRTFRADLSDAEEVKAAAHDVCRAFPHIDVLVNNAAVQFEPAFTDPDFDAGSIQKEIAVNFTAVCTLTALLLPRLLHGGEAAVVNVNSGLALAPKTHSAVYCATKAALNGFSQSLRYQLEDTNVRVMQPFMPLVDTGMTSGRGRDKLSAQDAARAIVEGIEKNIADHDVGKTRLLRQLVRFAPGVARRIMRAA